MCVSVHLYECMLVCVCVCVYRGWGGGGGGGGGEGWGVVENMKSIHISRVRADTEKNVQLFNQKIC